MTVENLFAMLVCKSALKRPHSIYIYLNSYRVPCLITKEMEGGKGTGRSIQKDGDNGSRGEAPSPPVIMKFGVWGFPLDFSPG